MLTRDTFTGPWAGLPVAWKPDNSIDEEAYRNDITRCCRANVPGVYTGGTSGEFYAMELHEFQKVTLATIETCHQHDKPAMIGCSSTYTLGITRRAQFAAENGADALQFAFPFWLEIGTNQIVELVTTISKACGHLPLSLYETKRAKRILTLDEHRRLHEAVPNYLMVKANAGTIGSTPEGCRELSKWVNVFVAENQWSTLAPLGARGGCSSLIYWNPEVTLKIWALVTQQKWNDLKQWDQKVQALFRFLHQQFGPQGLTDSAFDRLGGLASGFLTTNLECRKPYPSANQEDVKILRQWYQTHFPEMIYASN